MNYTLKICYNLRIKSCCHGGKQQNMNSIKLKKIVTVLVVFAVIVGVVAAVFILLTKDEATRFDNDGNEIELPDWIVTDHLPKNEYSRPGTKTDDIVGIVVHYVGNPGTSAKANRDYFASLASSGATYASSNFIIGLDGEIIECVPLGEVAYCSNNRNSDTVSIECCHPDETGEFTAETYASLVKLCRWLKDVYDIEADGVIRHYDVTGKQCPLYYVMHEDAWKSFVNEVFAN